MLFPSERLTLVLRFAFTLLIALTATASAQDNRGFLRAGVTVPLSGDAATYGELIRDGVELARTDLELRGLKVEVVYEDVPVPGARMLSAAKKLAEVDRIDVLAANFWNPGIPVMAPIFEKAGVPMLHTAAPDDEVLAASPMVFSTNSSIRAEACKMAQYASRELHAHRAAVLFVETNFGAGYAKHFSRCFSEAGGEVVSHSSFELSNRDFRAMLLHIREAKPDVIFIGSFGATLGMLLRQARELQLNIPLLSTYESEDPSVLEIAGIVPPDFLKFLVAQSSDNNDTRADFIERFRKRFGYEPRILAANAYDALVLGAATFARCGRKSQCFADTLRETRNYPGASGYFSISADRSAQKDFVLKTVERKSFVELAKIP